MTDAPERIFIDRGDFEYYVLEDGLPVGATEYIRADIARNEVLEKAAVKAERFQTWKFYSRADRDRLAAAIRSLKT